MAHEKADTWITLAGEKLSLVKATAVVIASVTFAGGTCSDQVVAEPRSVLSVPYESNLPDWPQEESRRASVSNLTPAASGSGLSSVTRTLTTSWDVEPVEPSFLKSWTYDEAVHGVDRWVRLDGSRRVGDVDLGAAFAVYRPPVAWAVGLGWLI